MQPGVIAYRVAAVFFAAIVLASCGTRGVRVGSEPPTSPSASETASPSLSASPSPTTSSAPWVTYQDPQGRFSFSYPGNLYLTVPEGQVLGSIYLESSKPVPQTAGTSPTGSMGDALKIEIGLDPPDAISPIRNPRNATVAGQSADYMIWRRGDPPRADWAEPGPRTSLVVHLHFIHDNVLYTLNLGTTKDPPDSDLDLFWKFVATFKLGK